MQPTAVEIVKGIANYLNSTHRDETFNAEYHIEKGRIRAELTRKRTVLKDCNGEEYQPPTGVEGCEEVAYEVTVPSVKGMEFAADSLVEAYLAENNDGFSSRSELVMKLLVRKFITYPKHFNMCFPDSIQNDRNYKSYMSIITCHGDPTPSKMKPEKHHIIPREWLTETFSDFSFDNEDPSNVVYLSVRDRILALQFLTLIFLEMKNAAVYKKMTDMVARRYHLSKFEFWKNPYLDYSGLISLLVEKRKQELENRKCGGRLS